MEWEDTDGDGHKELNGDVGPIAAAGATGLGVKAGLEAGAAAALAGTAGLSVAGIFTAPAAIPLTAAALGVGVQAGIDGAGAAALGGLAYYADRHDWKYKIEPGQVLEDTGEAIESAKDKAGDAVDWAKDKAGDVKDWA